MAAINHPDGGRFEGYGKPKMTPRHPKYAAAVVIKENGRDRLIRFGLQGAERFPKREGESKADAAKRSNWKKRHAQNIRRGPTSGAYWANRFLW